MRKSESRRSLFKRLAPTVRRTLVSIAVFSFFANLLMLTGPLFMLQIYDRVLPSGSVMTLISLTGIIALLFLGMGAIEYARSGLFALLAKEVETSLGHNTFDIAFLSALQGNPQSDGPVNDLRYLQQFLQGPALAAVFDAPWFPIYLAIIFLLHWSLGLVALFGAGLLLALAISNEITSRAATAEAREASNLSSEYLTSIFRSAEATHALGMKTNMRRRWQERHLKALDFATLAAIRMAGFRVATKTLRLFLQSAMLAAGAFLAIEHVVTPGAMIAASILLGRALAPVEQAVGHWQSYSSAIGAANRLSRVFSDRTRQAKPTHTVPPQPGRLSVSAIYGGAPGARVPYIKDISFHLEPGDILAIVGPSAAGKSSLGRLLTRVWKPLRGSITLDGTEFSTIDDEELGKKLGYLPQDIELFPGTIIENISRFESTATMEDVTFAARAAGIHEMIMALPQAYDTELVASGYPLSAGQRQRVGLARALFGSPHVVVLDEPDSNLDRVGSIALLNALKGLRNSGQIAIVITHGSNLIQLSNKMLVMNDGHTVDFGERQAVQVRLSGKKTRLQEAPA